MGKLLQLIAKLFGKNAISKTLGTRTNVIKLPGNEQKRLIKDELNIEAASDLAAQKLLKEAEDLIAEIPKMNDQEILTLTGNLQRLDNKLNPPSAEVLDITTKKPITGEGLEQLAARDGLPADVSPDSPIGKVMQGAQRLRKEKEELDRMLKDPVKQLEQEMQNPYRAGGALDPKMGIVRTAARQVLQKLAREGKIKIEDPREAKAIIEGYQGGVDPIEVFRKTFGQDALGDLANLGDELLEIDNRGGSFKELKKILDDEGFFDLQQPKSPAQGMTDEELMKRIKSEDPEEFATGGRVGFDDGGILSLEEAKKLNPGMFVDTTTYNPIPENAPNMAADEIAKVIMGTGFLPEEDDELGYPEGMEKPMSSKLFIFEQYVIPQRKKMMENFGLTLKEADDLIRQEMEKYRTNKSIGGRVGFQKGTSKIFDQLEMDVPHPYGQRVNYQIGGPAYDATDPIYGSSAITVTPDTIMGPQGNQIQAQMGKRSMTDRIFSGPAFDKYSAERTRAYTQSPNTFQYNIDANKAAGQFIQDRSKEVFGDNFLGKGLGILGTAASVPLAAAISPVHEAAQVVAEGRMEPGSGAKGFFDAFMAENPFSTAAQRALGVAQSLPNPLQSAIFGGSLFGNVEQGTASNQPTFDRKATIERILKNIEPTFNSSQYSPLNLDYLKSLSPSEIKDELDAVYLEGKRFRDADYNSGRIGTGSPFFRYSPEYMKNFNMNTNQPLQLSSQNMGYGLRQQLQELSPLIGEEALKSYTKRLDDSLIDYYKTNFTGDTDLQKNIFGIDPQYLNNGGRVGYAYGSGLKLIQLLQKAGKSLKDEIKKAVDDLIPSGDPKLDADMAVDNMLEDLNIDRDTIDQYDILDAYGLAYDELKQPLLKEIKETKSLAPKMIERFELKERYPGIDDKLLTQIIDDPDPQRKAEVLATIDQAFELMKQGKSPDEVLDIMKQMTDRTKQAGGGLSYLSGF